MSLLSKVRPVGSLVPKPKSVDSLTLPWEKHYTAVYTGSGTEALSLSVRAAIALAGSVELPEVIIPAYGCPDLVAAIVAQGARPVLVDFIENQPVMDEQCIIEALSAQTVAIVAVDFLGCSERLSSLSVICRKNALTLIEDSAQCFPPFSSESGLADYVILSFGRGKPINLMGGGALLVGNTNQLNIDTLLSKYPSVAVTLDAKWHLKRLIFNFCMSRFIYPLLEILPFLNVGQTKFYPLDSITLLDMPRSLLAAGLETHQARKTLHFEYDRKLAFLEQQGWKRITMTYAEASLPRLRYALLAPSATSRDDTLEALNQSGIGANAFYEKTLPEIVDAQMLMSKGRSKYPRARDFAARLLTIPTHEGVGSSDVAKIVQVFRRVTQM